MALPIFKLAILLPISLLLEVSSAESVTYSVGDKNAYLTARGEPDNHPSLQYYKSIRRTQLLQANSQQRQRIITHYDDPLTCTIYLAPSSIPNAGLGLYTAIPISPETPLSSPQIGILLQDPDFHNPSRNSNDESSFNLLGNYVWSATPLTHAEHEVSHGESICSGIGMMSNAHYGLINVDIDSQWKSDLTVDGTDSISVMASSHLTEHDVGRGSYTYHSHVAYKTLTELRAGEELFLSYGPLWFQNAEREFGGVISSKEHYEEADDMLLSFAERYDLEKSDGDDAASVAYEKMLGYIQDRRLRAALPDRVDDVPKAMEVGTARFSALDSIRTPDWLRENGACLDNLIGGTSTIAQAGHGAFATKSMTVGQVISTTPVVTLDRELLKLYKEVPSRFDGTMKRRHAGHQLLLNYCYGHPKSSLLFFPTSPSVSFINHGDKRKANAKIQWSDYSYHKSEWIDLPLVDIKKLQKTGLLMDIVATKDIERGDEILLYYGEEWEEKWASHIARWESSQKNFTNTLRIQTTVDLNSIEKEEMIKTIAELEEEPLPDHIMTRCGFALPGEDVQGSTSVGTVIKGYSAADPKSVPCEILDVEPLEGTDRYLYRAKVEHRSPQGDVTLYSVKYDSSQNFMRYTDKPYTRDYYSKGVFRHEIGLSEGIMPDHWLDL